MLRLVCFELAGRRFGSPIADVKETLAWKAPTRVFLTPAWVAGVEAEMKVTPVDWALLASQGAAWMSYWDSHVRGTGRKTR